MNDPYDLRRFKDAQARTYATALEELRSGEKQSHWMWFIFPQLRGLGSSPTANLYGISGLDEARAYLADPDLGPRLIECARAMLAVSGKTARQILGSPDDVKLCSSMTLFAQADPRTQEFGQVLVTFYGAHPDQRTLRLLAPLGGERSLPR